MTPVDNRVRLEASFIVLVGLLGEEKCDTRLLENRVRLEASFVVLVGLLGEEKCGKQTSAGCPDCSQSKNATHFVTYETNERNQIQTKHRLFVKRKCHTFPHPRDQPKQREMRF